MAHPDLDKVLNTLLSFAQQMINKYGCFHPFGASMNTNGEVACVSGYTGDEKPDPEELMQLLIDGFRQEAKNEKIMATGICHDARIIPQGKTQKMDAICARLEHNSGEAVEVYLPYRKGFLGRIKYGEILATSGQRNVFGGEKK